MAKRWNENGAATAADRLGQLRPHDFEVAVSRAGLLLLADRPDDYTALARAIAKQAAHIKDPCRNANLVARIAAFFPEPPIPREEFIRFAELGSRQDRGPWALHPLALAYLRDGNATKALELFDTALAFKDWKEGHIINLYGKVLALKALDRKDDAKKTLDQARKIVADVEARNPPHWPLHPHDYMSFRLLQREADPE